MSSLVRIAFGYSVAVAACGLAAGDASAQLRVGGGGVDVAAPHNTAAVAPDSGAVTVRDTRRTGGHTLRCWQEGRLLYESAGFRGPLERGPSTVTIPRRGGEGDAVTVINLNQAVCILAD